MPSQVGESVDIAKQFFKEFNNRNDSASAFTSYQRLDQEVLRGIEDDPSHPYQPEHGYVTKDRRQSEFETLVALQYSRDWEWQEIRRMLDIQYAYERRLVGILQDLGIYKDCRISRSKYSVSQN